jgi:hypothetical protein
MISQQKFSYNHAQVLHSISPQPSPDAFFFEGNVHMRRNNVVDAIQSFKNAIKVDPSHVISLVNLGAAMGNMNDFKGAVKTRNAYIHYKQHHWEHHHQHRRHSTSPSQSPSQSPFIQVQYYEQALSHDPTFVAARHNLASGNTPYFTTQNLS